MLYNEQNEHFATEINRNNEKKRESDNEEIFSGIRLDLIIRFQLFLIWKKIVN